jgi:hypothetical protein
MTDKPKEIVLALNQNANASECGSCHFFNRDSEGSEYIHRGHCRFRMPPNRVYAKTVWDGETMPLDTVEDTAGCDFWRSSGKTYIVSQRLKP